MNELTQVGKDTGRSCIFDFPDRPERPVPPIDPNNPPNSPPDYPHEPPLDWPPPLPPTVSGPPVDPVPGVDPIPGSNPHPYPPTFQNDVLPYYWKGEEEGWSYSEGIFLHGGSPYNANIGLIAHIFIENRFRARDEAGPFLLSETGFSIEAATEFNNIRNDSGLYFWWNPEFGGRRTFIAYYARYFNPATNNNFIAFSPAFITDGASIPPQIIIGDADFVIGPDTLRHHNGIGNSQTPVTKIIHTGTFWVQNDLTVTAPDIVVG